MRSLTLTALTLALFASSAGADGRRDVAALQEITGAYDWRGPAEKVQGLAYRLGRAIGARLVRGQPGRRPVAVLSGDTRLSTPAIKANLRRALRASGVDVIDLGMAMTPQAYEADRLYHPDATLQVTASHNPREDNGIKPIIFGKLVYGQELEAIGAEALAGGFPPAERGGSLTKGAITRAYLSRVRQNLAMGPRRFTIVVDANNGVGGALARFLRGYGFKTIGMNLVPDGRFPHSAGHMPDPTLEANLARLKAKVRATGAELGIALDGDVDRVVVVDRAGRTLLGDDVLALLAPRILAQHPGAAIVGDITSSDVARRVIEGHGGRFVLSRPGRAYIPLAVERERAPLGAEAAGHIWSRLGYDDGFFAAAAIVEDLSHGQDTLSERLDRWPTVHRTTMIRVPVPEQAKSTIMAEVRALLRERHPEAVLNEVDGVRATWPDGAWALVRPSGTRPEMSTRYEAPTAERLAALRALFEPVLRRGSARDARPSAGE